MKKTKNSISTFIGFADCITITGLFLAIISIFASLTDHLITAAMLILGSALCDLFDGPVARKRNKESPFGVALDGFNDFVTHLLAIALFGYASGLQSPLAVLCFTVFVVFGAMRLARYAVTGTIDGYYEGLPAGFSFFLIPLCLLFRQCGLPLDLVLLLYLAAALFMVSSIKVKKPYLKLPRLLSP